LKYSCGKLIQTSAMTNNLAASIKSTVAQAQALHDRGYKDDARVLCREVLERQPKNFDALTLLGIIAANANQLQEAATWFAQAIQVDRRSAVAHNNHGNALKSAGKFAAAIESYDRAIALDSHYVIAYNNRGNALRALQRLQAALESYDRAIALDPRVADFHVNRANTLQDLQRFEEAVAGYDRALALSSGHFLAYNNRGNALRELERSDAALLDFDRAIQLHDEFPEAHNNRGLALADAARYVEAMPSFDRAIALRPDFASAFFNRGNALCELGRYLEALADYEKAIALEPGAARVYNNRGNAFSELGQHQAAVASYDCALAIDAGYADAHANRALSLRELGQTDAAMASCDRAIDIDPDHADAHCIRGVLLQDRHEIQAALASYDQALALRPAFASAHQNKGYALLLNGDLSRGWVEHEWRWRNEDIWRSRPRRQFDRPQWLGAESLVGKVILLHVEQGLGDILQFCRYAPMVADRGATVILESPRTLKRLMESVRGGAEVVVHGEVPPAFDFHCPLMSLPVAFSTTLSTIPASVPYLKVDDREIHRWKDMLGPRKGLRVGLVWAGGFRPDQPKLWALDARRNIPLRKLTALRLPGIELYSLQKGQAAESELAASASAGQPALELIDHTTLISDFHDTAALMENLDLIISVDTAAAHLAGALGRPLWVLNRFDTDWRWLLDRTDSPWYPTARLYRQERAGDWDGVVERVRSDLCRLVMSERPA
jgi:tetratricopeptide (TPR) repeat protein